MDLQPHRPPARRAETTPTGRRGNKKWLLALAILVPLVLALAWGVTRFRKAPEPSAPAIPAPPATSVEPVVGAGSDTLGLLVLRAAPWGRITEITDASGFSVPLPEEVHTPLTLALPPGRYQIVLEYAPDGATPAVDSCEVEVRLENPEICTKILAEPDGNAYFKENGWWQ